MEAIYNSRNYQSLLASGNDALCHGLSTIVEIIRAYQPKELKWGFNTSTIVEIIRAYQPSTQSKHITLSTIVEIIRAYQPWLKRMRYTSIYNSRNYQSLLADCQTNIFLTHKSTIVEIIRAYQPRKVVRSHYPQYLQQQKLLEFTSLKNRQMKSSKIYNSRNYQSLLAE